MDAQWDKLYAGTDRRRFGLERQYSEIPYARLIQHDVIEHKGERRHGVWKLISKG